MISSKSETCLNHQFN